MSEKSLASIRDVHFNPSQEPATEAPVEEAPEIAPEEPAENGVPTGEAGEETKQEDVNPELEALRKRVQDNQKAFHNTYGVANDIAKRAVEAGALTDEEAKELLSKAKNNDFSLEENPLAEIDKKFTSEAPIVAGALGYSEEELNTYTQAFNQMMSLDPTLQEKLVAQPANQLTKWILEEGKNFLEVSPVIQEHGGALGAIRALSNNQPDVEALKASLKEEILKEMNMPTTGKPNLSRTGTSQTIPTPKKPATSLTEMKNARFSAK